MARVNVEEKLWLDPKFKALTRELGSEAMAVGFVVLFWRLAQSQFVKGQLVTESQFKLAGLPEVLFTCEFAARTDKGIMAKGDSKNFGWLVKRREAGKRGAIVTNKILAERRTSKINNLVTANDGKATANDGLLTPYSFLLSPKKEKNKERFLTGESCATSPAAIRVQKFIGAYVKAYQAKFNVRPDLSDPKLRGQLRTFAKNHGDIDRACLLIQVFFQMEDKWFETKTYDFTTFLSNTQKVALALDKGEQIKPRTSADKWLDAENRKDLKPKELTNGNDQSELFTEY